ncbi:UNKNOWN [Stylonychia lemnae]|uniref:Uncharacterized protein n=1 Tax=Stylonychia lemnae TaxID=5949 RepID=A0A078AA97_STYLE|nr:UNKNOWN [Stylonychia lemnae]|eukprot:CDW79119.1 UNKNOWN [Stylonychia lemnae]
MSAQAFQKLYRHFVIATSQSRAPIVMKHLESQTPYIQVADEIYAHSVEQSEVINPIFKKYCDEGEKYFSDKESQNDLKTDQQDAVQKKYERAIRDYLFLRQSCFLELQIMDLNRVGVDKDLKNIIKQTARHVGLEMPKSWQQTIKDPFDNRDKNNEKI